MDEPAHESEFLTYSQLNTHKSLKRNTLHSNKTLVKLSTHIQKSYSKLQTQRRQQSFQTLILNPYHTNKKQQIDFQPAQAQIIDHDIELKSYLSGQKIYKDINQPLTNFLNQTQNQNTPPQQNYKIPKLKHKKQKSKSQINVKSSPYFQKQSIFSRLNSIDKKIQPLKENNNFQSQPNHQHLSLKRNKTLQYLNINHIQRKSSFPAALEIQLVLKKVNQKKQITLNDIVKKLNLPKVKQGNIQKSIDNRMKSKQNQKILKRNNKTAQQIEMQKINKANLTASISRLQQNKIKELRKIERQIILSKMKSRLIKQKAKNQTIIQQNQSKKELLNFKKFNLISK